MAKKTIRQLTVCLGIASFHINQKNPTFLQTIKYANPLNMTTQMRSFPDITDDQLWSQFENKFKALEIQNKP